MISRCSDNLYTIDEERRTARASKAGRAEGIEGDRISKLCSNLPR